MRALARPSYVRYPHACVMQAGHSSRTDPVRLFRLIFDRTEESDVAGEKGARPREVGRTAACGRPGERKGEVCTLGLWETRPYGGAAVECLVDPSWAGRTLAPSVELGTVQCSHVLGTPPPTVACVCLAPRTTSSHR